jgi:hypothetical protein
MNFGSCNIGLRRGGGIASPPDVSVFRLPGAASGGTETMYAIVLQLLALCCTLAPFASRLPLPDRAEPDPALFAPLRAGTAIEPVSRFVLQPELGVAVFESVISPPR